VKELFNTHFGAIMLFLLLLVLIACHAFMVHAHRDTAMINWVEGMISGTLTPLVGLLASKQGQQGAAQAAAQATAQVAHSTGVTP
jgi:uncharacterized transporter YbjL